MNDLISRNEAYNAIIRHSQLAYRIATDEMGNDDALLDSIKFSDDFVVEVDDIAESLYACPTVDAVEVVHGHKIIRNRPYAAQYIYVGDDGYGNLVKRTDCSGTPIEISPATLSNPIEYCSECGKRMDGIWQNFCDNCGAKMDEVSE